MAKINILLAAIVGLLALNLIMPISTITGNTVYDLEGLNPECVFVNEGNSNNIPIQRCCYEAQMQLECIYEENTSCYTSKTSGRKYILNNDATIYCKKEGYVLPR